MRPRTPPLQRFWAQVHKTRSCWLWTGKPGDGGYPRFRLPDKTVYAHRWIYEQMFGPIPEGYEVDHVRERGCRHRHCVRPTHLEAVTAAENNRRWRAAA